MRVISTAALMLAATQLVAQTGPSHATSSSAAGAVPASTASAPLSASTTEPVSFKTANATLKGVIENVSDNERHGGVVIVTNGDEKSTALAKHMAKAFAAKGIVALTYESSSLSAAEAAAGVELLRLRGDILKDKVGIVALDGATAVATECSKGNPVLYTVSIDKDAKAESFGKMSQKALLVQATEDAFSPSADKLKRSVEKKHRNVTLWLAPTNDVDALDSANSSLLDRVTSWVADRTA
jgi:hypothetical protein